MLFVWQYYESNYNFLDYFHYIVGMVTKPANEQSQDFSIHNEDFPALPGSSYKDPTSSNDDSKSVSTGDSCMWL